MQKMISSNPVFTASTVVQDYNHMRHELPVGEGLEFTSPIIFSIGERQIAF